MPAIFPERSLQRTNHRTAVENIRRGADRIHPSRAEHGKNSMPMRGSVEISTPSDMSTRHGSSSRKISVPILTHPFLIIINTLPRST
jgi:hypothetical protein